MPSKAGRVILFLLLLLEGGCATLPSPGERQAAADRIAEARGFERISIPSPHFTLTAYLRITRPGAPLNLYIEGDGTAWVNRVIRSEDPTPRSTLVMELAGQDPAANVAYLARPGQYLPAQVSPCDPAYWSDKRFASEVIAAMDGAVSILAGKARVEEINLIGYSGGGAVAALIAAGRSDVGSLRTIAGNLDPATLNRHHGVSPLDESSRNPMDVAAGLKGMPQRHFVGSGDKVVPAFITHSFLSRMGSSDFRELTVVEGATHSDGWRERWNSLLAVPLAHESQKD